MKKFNNKEISKYNDVGGWLLLLCLSLTVFSPLLTIYNLSDTYDQIHLLFDQYPGLEDIYYIDLALSVALTLLSIRAGAALWRVVPGAVKMVKNYLLMFLGYSIIAAFLPFMAGLPQEANDAMIPEVVLGTVQSLIYFGVWYSYLNVSKRVKATYGTCSFSEPNDVETQASESEKTKSDSDDITNDVKFIDKENKQGGIYEIYSANNAETAKGFLRSKEIDEIKYYCIVETPEGNWGKDINGIYLEQLLPFQVNTDNAECEGSVFQPDLKTLEMAARGMGDNFPSTVECGKCKHQWLDGVRYQNTTVVKCPECKTLNKIDSNQFEVYFVE